MAVRRTPDRNETPWREIVDDATPNSLPSTQPPSGRHFSFKKCVACNIDYTPTAYHQKYCTTCGRLSSRRKSQALVDKIPNTVASTDCDSGSDGAFDQDGDDQNFTTPHQPSINSMMLSTNNTKRGNQHFSPLENEAEDKRGRNDYHTEADLKKLSTHQLISIILEQQSTINNLNSKCNQSEDALQAEIKKFNAMEDNFNKTAAELIQAKLCFADDFLSAMKKPSTYAEAVSSNQSPGPVTLIADLCDTSSRAPELNAIEELLGSRNGGPVAQSSYHRDGKLFITFGHKQEMETAINILNSKPKAKEVISATSLPKRLFPMIIRDVATRNFSGPADIVTDLNSVEGNRCLKGHVTKANVIFTNRNGKSLVKLLIDCRRARDEAISRGRIFSNTGVSYATLAVNPEREIRRCYNCCRYGHLASKCRSKLRCGRCSLDHQTHECTSDSLRCSNCNGNHISGCQSCPEQQKEITRYTKLFC